MAGSDFSRSYIIGYGSSPSRHGPVQHTCWRWPTMRSPGSRAKSFRTCQCLRPRRAGWALALSRPSVLPSVSGTTSAPRMRVLSRLNGWPVRSPVNASPMPSRAAAHDSGVDAVRYSFIVMDLHHLLLAGLPAHSAIPSRPGKTRINKCLRALSTLIHSTPAPTRCYIGAERVNCFCLTRFLGLGPGIPLLGLFRVKRGVLVAAGRRLLDQGGRPPAERNSTNGRPDLREVQGGSEGRGQFR